MNPRSFQDSVRLMRLSQALSELPDVGQAFVAMGTDANKRVLEEVGLLTDNVRAAAPNDLFVVVSAHTTNAAEAALTRADELLAETAMPNAEQSSAAVRPSTQAQARDQMAGANLVLISVPGPYATLEAAKALRAGMHVFLFSDNVEIADERRLKELAVSRGRLMMGPGCGTALINGVALGFANAVRRGPVGVVSASGTGLQELTTLIHRSGSGVSHAIGVGGRDLSREIDGLMMRHALTVLADDPETELIVLLSKPPHPAVIESVIDAARSTGKPVIANFLGDDRTGYNDGVLFTGTIQDTAEAAVERLPGASAASFQSDETALAGSVAGERSRLRHEQRFARGLFSGGSLCDEAMEVLSKRVGPVYSNIPLNPAWALADPWSSRGHCCVDMGEEEFTRGRPHPMIDYRLRTERLVKEAADPEVAVILLDVVLGYGSHESPAAALTRAIGEARSAHEGRHVSFVAHVVGTDDDPQQLAVQEEQLRDAGVSTFPTNAQAAAAAAAIVDRGR